MATSVLNTEWYDSEHPPVRTSTNRYDYPPHDVGAAAPDRHSNGQFLRSSHLVMGTDAAELVSAKQADYGAHGHVYRPPGNTKRQPRRDVVTNIPMHDVTQEHTEQDYRTTNKASYHGAQPQQVSDNARIKEMMRSTHFTLGHDAGESASVAGASYVAPLAGGRPEIAKINQDLLGSSVFVGEDQFIQDPKDQLRSTAQVNFDRLPDIKGASKSDTRAQAEQMKTTHFSLGHDGDAGRSLKQESYGRYNSDNYVVQRKVNPAIYASSNSIVGDHQGPLESTSRTSFVNTGRPAPPKKNATRFLASHHFQFGNDNEPIESTKQSSFQASDYEAPRRPFQQFNSSTVMDLNKNQDSTDYTTTAKDYAALDAGHYVKEDASFHASFVKGSNFDLGAGGDPVDYRTTVSASFRGVPASDSDGGPRGRRSHLPTYNAHLLQEEGGGEPMTSTARQTYLAHDARASDRNRDAARELAKVVRDSSIHMGQAKMPAASLYNRDICKNEPPIRVPKVALVGKPPAERMRDGDD